MSRGRKRKAGKTGFEEWGGYMAAKVSKLENQFGEEAGEKKGGIFQKIAIFVNGYTTPTANELKQIMLNNGGTFHHYYSRHRTTHIIASNLPNSKINNMNTDRIVKTQWITDSLSENRLLDYNQYLLYPANQTSSQSKLPFALKTNNCIKEKSVNNFSDSIPVSQIRELDKKEQDIFETPKLFNEDNSSDKSEENSFVTNENSGNGKEKLNTTKEFSNPSTSSSNKNVSNTSNPNFLSDFYNNSRLHHISTAGAMFKQYVKQLQSEENNFSGRSFLKQWIEKNQSSDDFVPSRKIFMHIDMDCFFVSVGIRKYPELKTHPVAVTHAKNNSSAISRKNENIKTEIGILKERFKNSDQRNITVTEKGENAESVSTFDLLDQNSSMAEIASCNYEARQKGIKNGTFLGAALKLCPELKTIPYDFEGYKEVSKDLYDTIASYTKEIEAVSCDEMFVDLSSVLNATEVSPLTFSSCLRDQIQLKTQCCCSVGMGPNMLIARLATKVAKPNGQCWISEGEVADFMLDQSVSSLPGVGWTMRNRLEKEGITSCKELQNVCLSQLQKDFGPRTGKSLYDHCRGIDNRVINKEQQRKSVSAEVNYGIRFVNWADADKFLIELCEEVSMRLNQNQVIGRTITLKLKVRAKNAPKEAAKYMGHGICDNVAKSLTLPIGTDDSRMIYRDVMTLLRQAGIPPSELRGIGIQISKLEDKNKARKTFSIKSFFAEGKPNTRNQEIEALKNSEENKSENTSRMSSLSNIFNTAKRTQNTSFKDKETLKNNEPLKNDDSFKEDIKLDLEVLNELPEEIRAQVLADYKAHGYNVDSELIREQNFPQPGTSGVGKPMGEEKREEDSVSLSGKQLSNPIDEMHVTSFSEIDESFLNALPEDLKADLKSEFETKKKILPGQDQKNFLFKESKHDAAPIKKKRGRPKGSSNIIKATEPKYMKRKSPQKRIRISSPIKKSPFKEQSPPPSPKSPIQMESQFPPKVLPQFCGESELSNIKLLICQWIESCTEPDNYDAQLLTDFCKSLIEDKDLEKLDLIIKFLRRKVIQRSTSWHSCFNSICKEVQNVMLQVHCSKLAHVQAL